MLEVIAHATSTRLPAASERRVVFIISFAEAHRAPTGATTCVVDLGSVGGSGVDVITAVHRLHRSRPWLGFVLVAAHADLDLEAEVIYGLRNLPRLALVKPRELHDIHRWKSLLEDQFVERHAMMIEADLRGAAGVDQARLFEDPEVKRLLRDAIHIRKVEELSTEGAVPRVGLWRRFKRLWGRSPSEILSLVRVLWAAHLRHHRYSSADIASVLGFRGTEHCARRLGARLGMRKSDLDALSYAQVVAAVVACLAQEAPVRSLVARASVAFRKAVRTSVVVAVTSMSGLDVDGVTSELAWIGDDYGRTPPAEAVG